MTCLRSLNNSNGRTMVQASKMQVSGHCGCGFWHFPASIPEFSELYQTQGYHKPFFKTISASQVQSYGLKLSPCNCATVSDPKESMLNKHPYILSAMLLIFSPLHCMAYRVLIPQLGFEPVPLVVGAQSPNHWPSREFLPILILDEQHI